MCVNSAKMSTKFLSFMIRLFKQRYCNASKIGVLPIQHMTFCDIPFPITILYKIFRKDFNIVQWVPLSLKWVLAANGLFSACKRSLGQGNVFTPVRQSFCSAHCMLGYTPRQTPPLGRHSSHPGRHPLHTPGRHHCSQLF